jgi:hypothetical protein
MGKKLLRDYVTKRKKTTRPFSLILDDIIRSPRISSSEYRLYSILISYCAKTEEVQTCCVSKTLLASHMGISVRGVTKIIRRLQDEGLVSINYEIKQRPSYTLNVNPPESFCPEQFKGRKIKSAINYIKDKGGVDNFQKRKRHEKVNKSRRTGWPENVKKSSTKASNETKKSNENMSIIDSTHELQFTSSEKYNKLTHELQFIPPMNSSSPPHELQFTTPMNSSSSRYRVNTENVLEKPNGLKNQPDHGRLGFDSRIAENTVEENLEERNSIRRTAPKNIKDDVMAKPNKEQIAAERNRIKSQKKGNREKVNDVGMSESKSTKSVSEIPKKKRRGAGAPPSNKINTQDVLDNHLTADPDTVSEVPNSPWTLYTHFTKVVRKKYPDARLSTAADGKYLKWGKLMLKKFTRGDLYEMIQVLVLDYENIAKSRVFFKFSGTPYPTYEQFYCNTDALLTFVGTGIIAPPSVRFSHYANDYNNRKNKSANNEVIDNSGKSIDQIQAIRDQVNS